MKLEKQRFHIHCFMRILPEIIKIESWGSKCFHIFMPNALQEACNSFTLLGLGAYVIIENNQCAILLFSFFANKITLIPILSLSVSAPDRSSSISVFRSSPLTL